MKCSTCGGPLERAVNNRCWYCKEPIPGYNSEGRPVPLPGELYNFLTPSPLTCGTMSIGWKLSMIENLTKQWEDGYYHSLFRREP